MRALQKQAGTTRTIWKSGTPYRRFDAEIDTITSFHITRALLGRALRIFSQIT
jgi:hypothetical protein